MTEDKPLHERYYGDDSLPVPATLNGFASTGIVRENTPIDCLTHNQIEEAFTRHFKTLVDGIKITDGNKIIAQILSGVHDKGIQKFIEGVLK